MKILILLENIIPYQLARISANKDINIVIGVSSVKDSFSVLNQSLPANNIKVIHFKKKSLVDFYKFLVQNQIDCIFTSGYNFKLSLIALLCKKKCKNLRVYACCESNEYDYKRNFLVEFIKKNILKCFDGFLVGSKDHEAYIKKIIGQNERINIQKGYNVIDNIHFAKTSKKTKNESLSFLSVGRFERKKNHVGLIKAYKILDNICIENLIDTPPLYIIGDGYLKGKINNLIKSLKLSSKVILTGAIPYDLLPYAYHNASIFIHPSTTEQWGLVVNEAMASSLPVIVSNKCGCSKFLVENGKNGYTFDPNNYNEIALLMYKFLVNKNFNLDKMGKHSKNLINKYYPLSSYSEGTKKLIENQIYSPNSISKLSNLFIYLSFLLK